MGKRRDVGEDGAAVSAWWGRGTPLPITPDCRWDARRPLRSE